MRGAQLLKRRLGKAPTTPKYVKLTCAAFLAKIAQTTMPNPTQPEKLQPTSLDVVKEQITKLKGVFPEAFTEGGKIDFDKLKLTLGEAVDVGKERYGMNWPGKADCFKTIQRSSAATLVPARDESVNFDETENLIIEGDNLEVLKLLQKSYMGKVKMIYIDPPYNTGNDFIYPDNYSESLDTYLRYTGQVNAEGLKLTTNTEADGRFHSKWLNMMYPRLFLARNLLKDEGVLFVSIDDHEIDNLKKLCNEIFGEENFCGVFIWEKKKKPSFLNASMGVVTEYIVAYAKMRPMSPPFIAGKAEDGKKYPFNNAGNSIGRLTFPPQSVCFGMPDQIIEPQDMSEGNIITRLLTQVEIKNATNANAFTLEGEWRYSQAKVNEFVTQKDEIYIAKIPFRPNYISCEDKEKKCKNLLSIQSGLVATYEDATAEITDLFNEDVMDYPKPTKLIRFLAKAITNGNEIILDFFAGSGTTAQSVLELNKDDGERKFILVQLPEPIEKKNFSSIADITKERVRRVIKKLNEEDAGKLPLENQKKQDRGFKVFKLQQSNFKQWNPQRPERLDDLEKQLELHINHIEKEATEEEILYELLLKAGFQLTTKIEKMTLTGKTVYAIESGTMLICLNKNLTTEAIKAIADKKPYQVILLDEGFKDNDQLKTNAVQIMKSKGVEKFQTV